MDNSFGNLKNKKWIKQTYGAETVLSEGGVKQEIIKLPPEIIHKPKFKIYGLLDSQFDLINSELDLLSGNLCYYIVEDTELQEFCEIKKEQTIESKKIKITKNNGNNYYWVNQNTVKVQHDLDGIVDYVLRYKDLNRVLTTDTMLDLNNLEIVLPPQIELGEDDYYELVVYKLSNDINDNNIFKYKEFSINDDNLTIHNSFETEPIDYILRTENNERIIFGSEIKTNNIIFLKPEVEKYSNIVSKIYIYKCNETKTYNTKNLYNNDLTWLTLTDNNTNKTYNALKIIHNLNAEVNVIIRDKLKNNLLIKYNDYNIENGNAILIIFPENKGEDKSKLNLTISVYPIFRPEGVQINGQ